MTTTTYRVLQVHKGFVPYLETLIQGKNLSFEDLVLILDGAHLRDVKCVNDKVYLRSPYERRQHTEDKESYFDSMRKNSARLSGIAFEEI